MKKYIGFIFIVLLIACTTDDIPKTENVSTPLILAESGDKTVTNIQQRAPTDIIEVFRLQMEWAAFITAEILIESNTIVGPDNDITSEMNEAMAIHGNVIPLKSLLGAQSNYTNFKTAFKNKFLAYYIGDCRPNFGVQRPPNQALLIDNPPPPEINPDGEPSSSYQIWAENFTTSYINQITNENCVELFIPNGLDYGTPIENNFPSNINLNNPFDIPAYTVAAHPLTNQTAGGQGWRIMPDKPKITVCQTYTAAQSATLFPIYTSGNLIVARPYRDANLGCNYVSIDVIDFTLYLN